MTKSTLKALVEIIAQNIDVLEAALEERGVVVPSLDEPFSPGSDLASSNPELMATADLACRAALQLVQIVRLPQLTLMQDAVSHLTSVSMRVAVELHIAEILNEAGPEGMHVEAIATKCHVDSTKLAAVLRCLAGRWIFKEVAPDIFANNRLSSLLDKGKSFEDLKNCPETMYEKPQAALSAALGHFSDECLKSSAFFYEAITDPEFAFSGEANHAGFSKAFQTDKSFWEFLELPEQRARRRRFGVAMAGTQAMEPPGLPSVGYQWGNLLDGATVVDVGGGVGMVAIQLAEAFPKLQFIVQDLPAVIEEGEKRFDEEENTSNVKFEAHDFFTPNPVKEPDVFLLKYITHDWSDAHVKKILSQLRDAASSKTRLVVMDRIVPFTCPVPEGHIAITVPGVIHTQFPSPITIAFADNPSFKASTLMMALTNGQERTLKHFVDLFASVGWRVDSVVQFEGSGALPSSICAVPI